MRTSAKLQLHVLLWQGLHMPSHDKHSRGCRSACTKDACMPHSPSMDTQSVQCFHALQFQVPWQRRKLICFIPLWSMSALKMPHLQLISRACQLPHRCSTPRGCGYILWRLARSGCGPCHVCDGALSKLCRHFPAPILAVIAADLLSNRLSLSGPARDLNK